jgi:CBS domain-containing protein
MSLRAPARLLTVKDLMSRMVITIRPSDEIDIAKLEMDLASIRHLPVTDRHGALMGVVSKSDLLQALVRQGGGSVRVEGLMAREVITVVADAPAYEAARLMSSRKIGCLPVIDQRRRVVGILTATDLLIAAERALRVPG